MMISFRNFLSWVSAAYAEEHVFSVVCDLVVGGALGREQQVENGDPDLPLDLGQLGKLSFLDLGPLAVFELLATAFFVGAQPGPFLDEHHAGHEHVVLEVQVADDRRLHMLHLVCDVSDDADGREGDVELDGGLLSVEVLLSRQAGDLLGVCGRVEELDLAVDQPVDVPVAVVDQLEQVVVCGVDGSPVEQHALEQVHEDRLVEELVRSTLLRCSS